MPANIYDIGYENILGAQGGGQDLQDIISSMYGLLEQGEYLGDWGGTSESFTPYKLTSEPVVSSSEQMGDPDDPENAWNTGGGQGLNYEDLMNTLGKMVEGYTDDKGIFHPGYTSESMSDNPMQQGISYFYDMLQQVDIPGLSKEYSQGIGDIGSEYASQFSGLQKGYTSEQKSGRYGSLAGGASRRGAPGSRKQYMSDIYGLQGKRNELIAGQQEQLEEDFRDQLARWQAENQPPLSDPNT